MPKNEKASRKRKRAKDPNAPKRALSAFFWFCNDERPKVKETMTDNSVTKVAKELGRRWNDMSDEVKAKYVALAAKDKARYEKEANAYKSKKVKESAKPKARDDSDEEEEEDEDTD